MAGSRFIAGVPMKPATASVSRRGEDLARRADLDDAAVHEDGDAVGERHRLFLVVGDVDGGRAERALQLVQAEPGLEAQLGVEVGERLVEQEQLRLADDRPGQRHALLLAAGELAGRAREQVADVDLGGGGGDRALDLARRRADHLQRKADVLRHRHVRIERVALEHHRHVALARLLRGDVGAVHRHRAGAHRLQAGEDAQRRRLARARGAEQDEELARPDLEVDAVQHRGRAVALDDALRASRSRSCAPPSALDRADGEALDDVPLGEEADQDHRRHRQHRARRRAGPTGSARPR